MIITYLVTFFISVYFSVLSNCSISCDIDSMYKLLANFTSRFETLGSDSKSSCNDTNKFIDRVIFLFVLNLSKSKQNIFKISENLAENEKRNLFSKFSDACIFPEILFENCSNMPRKFYKYYWRYFSLINVFLKDCK